MKLTNWSLTVYFHGTYMKWIPVNSDSYAIIRHILYPCLIDHRSILSTTGGLAMVINSVHSTFCICPWEYIAVLSYDITQGFYQLIW